MGNPIMVFFDARKPVRRPLGLRSARMGWLLGLGSGRKRGFHALVSNDRVPAFGDDPGTQGHAQSLEPGAHRNGLRLDTVWYLHNAQRDNFVGPLIYAIGSGSVLSNVFSHRQRFL